MMAETWIRPVPVVTAESEVFYSGLKERRFLVPRCRSCDAYNWTPYPACRSCQSMDLEWVEVSGRGTIYTFTEIHVGARPFTTDGPYIWAFAQLEEGPRPLIVMGNLIGVGPEEIQIGMPVSIGYHDIPGHDLTMYHFEPTTDATSDGAEG